MNPSPDAIDIALEMARAVEAAGGEYFVGGSVASSLVTLDHAGSPLVEVTSKLESGVRNLLSSAGTKLIIASEPRYTLTSDDVSAVALNSDMTIAGAISVDPRSGLTDLVRTRDPLAPSMPPPTAAVALGWSSADAGCSFVLETLETRSPSSGRWSSLLRTALLRPRTWSPWRCM